MSISGPPPDILRPGELPSDAAPTAAGDESQDYGETIAQAVQDAVQLPATAGDESQDYSHLLRSEGLVSDADLRVDVADKYARNIVGNEEISLESSEFRTRGTMTFSRGARSRTVGKYTRTTDNDEILLIGDRVEETVAGGVHLKAKMSAEALIGGAYVNTIAGPYLRIAGWVDSLTWGGWAEVDVVRAELSALMIRSHVGYAHAAGIRLTMASRLIDDFQTRTENFGILGESGTTHQEAGAPGGGINNEA